MAQKEMPEHRQPAQKPRRPKPPQQQTAPTDRNTAIRRARAIRREAAGNEEQDVKARAVTEADSVMEHAAPAPSRKPRHRQTAPKAVSGKNGKFGRLDEAAGSDRANRADADEIISQLKRESGARRAAPAAAKQDFSYQTETPAEHSESAWTQSEETVLRELRRYSAKRALMTESEAADQYRRVSRDGKAAVKALTRRTDRAWKRESSEIQAKIKGDRIARTSAKINVAVCMTMLFAVAVGMLVLKRPTVSMEENRNLAKMPSFSSEKYLSGEYTNGVAEYYNDTVPFRSTFKALTQKFRKHMGLTGGPVIHGGVLALEQEDDLPEITETTEITVTTTAAAEPGITVTTTTKVTEATTAKPDEKEEEPVQGGEISNNILVVNKRGIMLFGAGEKHGEGYAQILNRFQKDLPNVKMYNMTIPTVCSFYTPDEFKRLIASEKKNLDYINSRLEGVIPVDAYSALEKHKDEPIFMRTDHHWGSLGAFYAAEEFSAVARVPFARIEEYEKNTRDDYVGTLYGYSGDITLKENPEEFSWYIPKAPFKTTYYSSSLVKQSEGSFFRNMKNVKPVSYYLVFMYGDDHMVHVQTEVNNGRKLAVIKDSYGNALIPWLTSSFQDIYVIDMRYFKVNAIQFMKDKGVTDVLFCMNSFSANGGNGRLIDKIRTQ